MKRAVISGVSGQDGSYLVEFLLKKGYAVHGILRNSSRISPGWMGQLEQQGHQLNLHYADLSDHASLERIFNDVKPDEFYHLAGQSNAGISFKIPEQTLAEIGVATLNLFEICRKISPQVRVFNALSAEIFGVPDEVPQNEDTSHRPVNPYGCAKSFVANLGRVYRDAYGMFVTNGILYNHESPRRPETFVTRKITAAAFRIARGAQEILTLGNLNSERDWGYAPQFVEGMWKSLQQAHGEDYIFATGTSTSVREFATAAFREVGIELLFQGSDESEVAIDAHSKKVVLQVDRRFFRPTESQRLVGNPAKAMRNLEWFPTIRGAQVAQMMTKAEATSLGGESVLTDTHLVLAD